MDAVINLILGGFADLVSIAKSFEITALGFTFTFWDFQLSLLFVSIVIPLFFSLKSPRVSAFLRLGNGSERNDKGG